MKRGAKWQEVVDNLLYFCLELLPGATSQANWTEEGVDRALSWGGYCERAARRLRHNGSVRKALTQTAQHLHCDLALIHLQDARQILLTILMQNQLLEAGVKQYIKQKAYTVLGSATAATLTLHTAQQEVHSTILFSQLRGKKYQALRRTLGTRLLLEAAAVSGKDRLQECLDKVVVQPEGLSMLLDSASSEDRSNRSSLGPQVVAWVERVLFSPQDTNYRRLMRQMSSLPAAILSQVTCTHPTLFLALLAAMQREALMLDPYYDTEKTNWLPRNPAASALGYPDLARICAALLTNQSVGTKLREAIARWGLGCSGAVWADLLKDSTHQCKQLESSEASANMIEKEKLR